jgi:hypothetical protein
VRKREDIAASNMSPTVSARRSGETTSVATRPTSERRQTLAAKNQQQATEGGAGLPKIVSTAADALLSFQSLEEDDSVVSDGLSPGRAPAHSGLAPCACQVTMGETFRSFAQSARAWGVASSPGAKFGPFFACQAS